MTNDDILLVLLECLYSVYSLWRGVVSRQRPCNELGACHRKYLNELFRRTTTEKTNLFTNKPFRRPFVFYLAINC